jgi:hypothetical protein
VARRQPANPEGWLLLGLAAAALATVDGGLYAVLDYRMRHGRLPLGETAVFIREAVGPGLLFIFMLVILLFPDGRLTRRWTWVLWSYLAVLLVAAVSLAAGEAGSIAGQHIQVNVNGNYTGPANPAGVLGLLANVTTPAFYAVPLFWPVFVGRQVSSWRHSAGERRQQLKWLMAGAVIALAGAMVIAFGPSNAQLAGRIARDLAFVALTALPVSIGVGMVSAHARSCLTPETSAGTPVRSQGPGRSLPGSGAGQPLHSAGHYDASEASGWQVL